MARNIPKALATFVSNDTDTARMFNNLQSAIQPLLDFNNKWFQDKGSALNVRGALQAAGVAVSSGISGALTSFRKVPDGTIAAPGLAFLNNTAIGIEREGTGNSEQWNFVYNGVKFLSITKSGYIWTCFASTAGLMLFNNAAGTLLGTLRNDGTLSLPSFVSAQGFRQTITCGYWNNSYTANANAQMQLAVTNNNGSTAGTTPFVYKWPVAGSIVQMSSNQAGPITGVNSILIYRNGTNTLNWNAGTGGTNLASTVTYSKGTAALAFAVNDTLTIFHQNTVAGNTQMLLHVGIEQGA